MSLRYVGASPNNSLSIANVAVVNDYIQRSIPIVTSPIDQARQRGALYPELSEVQNQFSQYASNTFVNAEANKYYSNTDAGVIVAQIAGGKIPLNQAPSDYSLYLEPYGGASSLSSNYSTIVSGIFQTINTITVSNPGYKWLPFVSGFIEADVGASSAIEIVVRDQSNVDVGRGVAKRGKVSTAAIGPNKSNTYTGAQTFRLMARRSFGSNTIYLYGVGKISIMPMPAE